MNVRHAITIRPSMIVDTNSGDESHFSYIVDWTPRLSQRTLVYEDYQSPKPIRPSIITATTPKECKALRLWAITGTNVLLPIRFTPKIKLGYSSSISNVLERTEGESRK